MGTVCKAGTLSPGHVHQVRRPVVLALVLSCLMAVADISTSTAATYYVATDGDDNNPGTIDEPFATITKARDTIRASGEPGNIVNIRGGMYYQTEAITFTHEDSGADGAPNVYRSYPGEQAIISGGMVLDPQTYTWEIHTGSIYKTNVGELTFRSLFVDDTRATRARTPNDDPEDPNKGYFHCKNSVGDANQSFEFYEGDINPNWTNLQSCEIQFTRSFTAPKMRIDTVDDVNNIVKMQEYVIHGHAKFYSTNRYYVENVFEGLDEEGEWYLNTDTNDLYYWPVGGKNPNTSEIVIPVLGNTATFHQSYLLSAYSLAANPTEYIEFRDLTFAHSDSYLPSCGLYGFTVELENVHGTLATPNWYGHGPAIRLVGQHITFEGNTVKHIGGIGIRVHGENITLSHNEITDIGASAILLGPLAAAGMTGTGNWVSANNRITDNTIHGIGTTWPCAIAVGQYIANDSYIAHNEIYDVSHMGIHVGSGIAYGGDNTCNMIEYNHIYDVTKVLGDSAALYFVGIQTGTVAQYNKVHDCFSVETAIYEQPHLGGWGVYFDESSTGSTVRNNWLYRVNRGLTVNWGPGNAVENNVFAAIDDNAYFSYVGLGTTTIQRNIIYNTNPVSILHRWLDHINQGVADYNLWYNTDGSFQGTWDSKLAHIKGFTFSGTVNVTKNPDGTSAVALVTGNQFVSYWHSGTIIDINSVSYEVLSVTDGFALTVVDGPSTVEGVSYTVSLNLEANSIEEDPLFVDFDNDNFALEPNSPALSAQGEGGIGFQQIDMSGVGPRTTISGSDPNAPVLQAIGNKSVNENSALIFDVNATDPGGDAITYSSWSLPSGATFSNQTFSWTPSNDQAGTYQVRFIATDDGNAYDYETITITVNNVNRAPVLGPIANQSVNETALLSFSVSATDADSDVITYSVTGGLPAGAVFASQTFTWTPSYDQAGTHSVTFIADDGQAQDSQPITITVINVNRAPVLTAIGNKSAYADVLLTFTIDATDPDGDAITYSAGTLPSGATFTDQDFNWTPSQGQVGSYDVTFIAGDGQLQDSEAVTMTVDVDSLAPTVTNCSPAADSIQVPLNNLITLNIADAGIGVEAKSVKIKVRINDNPNNYTVYFGDTGHYTSPEGDCRRLGTKADYRFVYQSTSEMLYYDQTVTVTVNATDLAGNVMDEYSYSFATEMHSFGQNKQVNSGLDNNDRPVTVCDSSGNIWSAWQAGPIDNRDIYISKLTAGEENFNSTIQLTNNANDQCNPAVALDSNDKLYVVWQDNREGDWDIYVSTSVDGISWSTETRINDPNGGNQINPAIVIDGQSPNQAHVVWQDDRAGNQDIFIATSSNGFATPTVSQQITFDNFDHVEPAVAADSANTIYVVWTDMRNGSSDIYGAASNNPWTNVAIVSNVNNQSSPAIVAESAGSILHLLWVDDTSGNNDIYYASSNGLPGSPLTGSSIIDDSSGADQLDPTIAVTGSTDNNLKVFACWQDWRNTDTDLYFAELSSGSGTNVFVDEGGSNAYQGEPAVGIGEYGHPYIMWADSRSTDTDIYYAGSTFIEPVALASELVTTSASSSTIVGTDPQAITTVDDVSIVVPAGACSYDVAITVTKIANPLAFAAPCLGGYDFGPSGIQFSQPVTITIPYAFSGADGSVTPYWFNSLTGALSQQGITDIRDISISSSLHALSFKTTHFTAFYLLVGGGGAAAIIGGGGGGGCSVSASGEGNIVEFIIPYIGLAVVMAILKMRDARYRKARNMTAGKC